MVHLITIIMIAIGLSMDAFSLAVLYGTLNLDKRKTLTLSGSVGVFHFFMPLLGNLLGILILNFLPVQPNIVVGIIFLMISLQMIISVFKEEEIIDLKSILTIFLFAFTVSIDSFSTGIGLPGICDNKLLAVSIFSVTSFTFTFVGLKLGSKLSQKLGKLATPIGGTILLLLAIYYLIK